MTRGSLTFIGLGLYDHTDMSIKAYNKIKSCEVIFSEFYTSVLTGVSYEQLEKSIGKRITVLTRKETEEGASIIKEAKNRHVCFLTGGDTMTATTHIDLRLRAIKEGIPTDIIHGTSIVTAVPGVLGLQQYKFGRITTLVIPEEKYFPTSPYDVIENNKTYGLHTMVLLDIQTEKNRFMTASEGIKILMEMEKKIQKQVIHDDDVICVVCQAGSSKPKAFADTLIELKDKEFGPPLHTIVLPGNLHFMEIEALQTLAHLPEYLGKKLQKL
jgi:diphthine synthase